MNDIEYLTRLLEKYENNTNPKGKESNEYCAFWKGTCFGLKMAIKFLKDKEK